MRLNAPAPPPSLVDEEEAGYRFVGSNGIFRVAVRHGRMVALACAILRDDEWFLSGFWADPNVRQQGIGGPLLREVWDEGVRRGARRKFVWASPDPTAIATYLKLGMLPGSQLFAFSGTPRLPAAAGFETRQLAVEDATAIDRVIRGVGRSVDHQWWLAQPERAARLVTVRGKPAGYYYYAADGRVGPAAWLESSDGSAVLSHAMRDAADQSGRVQLVAPGMNHVAIAAALAAGLRLERSSHLLWTEPFGRMERYIPSGPLLF
ncbi:MAG: GNAT family N-acetyltransferase [Chloroflexota bacterium]|nr:GNAT family N-acetyltransferase [Chloroflexota bacterium]